MTPKKKEKNKLTKAEQKTTATFKLMSSEIDSLKKSLKKTQDELEKMRNDKFNHEKNNSILEHRLEKAFWIEVFKFFASAGIGLSASYLVEGESVLFLAVGIPSVIVFIVTLIFSKK